MNTSDYWVIPREKPKVWAGERWDVAHEKLDGRSVTMYKDLDGRVYAFERKVSAELELLSRFPVVSESRWARAFNAAAPRLSCVQGELYAPGRPRSDVPTALRDASIPLHFDVFSVPYWDSEYRGGASVQEAARIANDADLVFARWWTREQLAERSVLDEVRNFENDQTRLLQFADELGIEGFVLKNLNYEQWWKVKPEVTLDAIVTGSTDGKGKWLGFVGSLKCSVYDGKGGLVEIARCSGMDDETRFDITDLEADGKLNGLVVELECQGASAKGRLDHPRFKAWRPDKPAHECTIDQLKGLRND